MPDCSAVAVLLIQLHHRIKNYFWWWAINIIVKCGKTCQGVFFFNSFTGVFFTICNKISDSVRLVPTADETTITMILQINNYNTTHNIYISSKTNWCSHWLIVAIIVTQNLLSWNQDGRQRVWHDVIFVFKTSKKVVKTWYMCLKNVSFFVWFLAFVKQVGIFLYFFG